MSFLDQKIATIVENIPRNSRMPMVESYNLVQESSYQMADGSVVKLKFESTTDPKLNLCRRQVYSAESELISDSLIEILNTSGQKFYNVRAILNPPQSFEIYSDCFFKGYDKLVRESARISEATRQLEIEKFAVEGEDLKENRPLTNSQKFDLLVRELIVEEQIEQDNYNRSRKYK